MKKILLLIVLAELGIFVFSVWKDKTPKPEDTIVRYLEALRVGDSEKYFACVEPTNMWILEWRRAHSSRPANERRAWPGRLHIFLHPAIHQQTVDDYRLYTASTADKGVHLKASP